MKDKTQFLFPVYKGHPKVPLKCQAFANFDVSGGGAGGAGTGGAAGTNASAGGLPTAANAGKSGIAFVVFI